jgi:hypothetical protein
LAGTTRSGVDCQAPAVSSSSASKGIFEAAASISAGGAPITTATGNGALAASAAAWYWPRCCGGIMRTRMRSPPASCARFQDAL